MKERTVFKRIVKSKCLVDTLVWLGFEYEKTENGYEFDRSRKFESAWKDIHALRQFYNNSSKNKK